MTTVGGRDEEVGRTRIERLRRVDLLQHTLVDDRDLELGDAEQCIFVNQDGTYGWTWNRGNVGDNTNPNFPEVEFGINPWGRDTDPWEELPSSTDALPLQVRDINSATLTLRADWSVNAERYNLTFETWLVNRDPRTGPASDGAAIIAELMAFFAWDPTYWPETPETSGSFNGGGNNYTLYQDTAWDEWQYFQARISTGSPGPGSANITFNIKAYLDYVVGRGYSSDLWVARFEVGNEVFPNSNGQITIRQLSYELNGQTYESVQPL